MTVIKHKPLELISNIAFQLNTFLILYSGTKNIKRLYRKEYILYYKECNFKLFALDFRFLINFKRNNKSVFAIETLSVNQKGLNNKAIKVTIK